MKNIFKKLRTKWEYKKAVWRFRNRKVTKAKFINAYLIMSGVFFFVFSIVGWMWLKLPFLYAFTPIYLILAFVMFRYLRKNMKLIMTFVGDVEQGRLLMDLNEYTHFTEEHKLRLINWVYLKRHTIRNERWLEISQKTELTKEERIVSKYKVVTCPQQLMDGFNKAHLIAALIHAHENIQVLDSNLRTIMGLTDENMNKFDLQVEVNKCRTSEYKRKMNEYLEIGEKNSKTKKK